MKDKTQNPFVKVIGVLCIGIVMPIIVGLFIAHYSNTTAYNKLLLTDGFIPLRNTYTECSSKSLKLLKSYTARLGIMELAYSAAEKTLSSYNPTIITNANDETLFMIKQNVKLNQEINDKQDIINNCWNRLNNIMDNMATLLNTQSYLSKQRTIFINRFRKLQEKVQEIGLKKAVLRANGINATSPFKILNEINNKALESFGINLEKLNHMPNNNTQLKTLKKQAKAIENMWSIYAQAQAKLFTYRQIFYTAIQTNFLENIKEDCISYFE